MRIISGHAGGIQLLSPKDAGVRPTTDRVKESMFGSLEPIADQIVVDLFSGSGALGLEAWSRGAAEVYLVESKRQNVKLIERNRDRVAKAMGDDAARLEVIQGDVLQVPQRLRNVSPDIVIADPPYNPPKGGVSGAALLANAAFSTWAKDALLVLEQSKKTVLDLSAGNWQLIKQKRYGDTVLHYLKRSDAAG